jgi:hypothetical protein
MPMIWRQYAAYIAYIAHESLAMASDVRGGAAHFQNRKAIYSTRKETQVPSVDTENIRR